MYQTPTGMALTTSKFRIRQHGGACDANLWGDFFYISSMPTGRRSNALITAKKKVAENAPRLSLLAIDTLVSGIPIFDNRRASSS
jgi:hypothetical protein